MKHLFLTLLFACLFLGAGLAQKVEEQKKGPLIENTPKQSAAASYRIYPNPAINYFQVETVQDVAEIILFNVFGRQIESFEMRKGQKYDIESLPMGIYLVQMQDSEGKIVSTKRLSKRLP